MIAQQRRATFGALSALLASAPLLLSAQMADEELRHYYRLFNDTSYIAPTALQPRTLIVSEEIYQLTDGWQSVTPDQRARVIAETREHFAELTAVYPTFRVRLTENEATVLTAPASPLTLTPGLLRVLIVEVVNATGRELALTPVVEESEPYGRAPILVASGQTRPALVPVIVLAEDLDEVTLSFIPSSNGGMLASVPVAVETRRASTLTGEAIKSSSGEPFPSRIYVEGSDHILRHARELGANRTLSEKPVVFRPAMMKVPFFYTDGTFTVDVPAGETRITLERGYETPITKKVIDAPEGETKAVSIESDREMDMMARGWISGDTHIHWVVNEWNENEDIDLLAMVQRAEDLRIANNLTLYQWVADGNSFTKPDQYPMGPVERLSDEEYHIQMAEEFRNDNHFGHLNLLNLKELIEPISTGPGSGGPPGAIDYPINAEIIRRAREQGGISIEAHNLGPFHASGVAANVIQGMSDSLDQLEPENYYNFLNSGVRIGLSNGSDHPARLVGSCRVYVHAPGPLDYDVWCRRLAEGRTFTTSGPLLTLTVNGREIGEVLDLEPGETLDVTAKAWSRNPLGRVEIVSNGDIIATLETEEKAGTLHVSLSAQEARWFVARCSRTDSFDALAGPNIAHTSAIYVDLDGQGVFFPEAAEGWIRNVEIHRQRLLQTGNFENDAQRQEALDYIDKAISLYQKRIDAFHARE